MTKAAAIHINYPHSQRAFNYVHARDGAPVPVVKAQPTPESVPGDDAPIKMD